MYAPTHACATHRRAMRMVLSGLFAAALLTLSTRATLAQVDTPPDLPSINVAEAPSIRMDNMDLTDGIGQGTIYQITQDRKGFLWFGTQSGLHRYDGHEFKIFEPVAFDTTSIQSGWVWGVDESSDGSIWASTNAGLSRLDPERGNFENFTHDPSDSTSLASGFTFASLEASDGTIWVASDGGLSRMDAARTGTFKRFDRAEGDSTALPGPAFFLREGPDGFIWVSTADGLARVDPSSNHVRTYYSTGRLQGPSAPQAVLGSAADARDPYVLWYGTGRGIMRFDIRTAERRIWVPYPDEPSFSELNVVLTVTRDPLADDILWLGTSGGGLLRFDATTGEFDVYNHDPEDPHSVASPMANTVFADRAGTVWVGYGNKGLGKFNPTSVSITHIRHDPGNTGGPLAEGSIWGMLEADGYLWTGNYTNAGKSVLTRYSLSTGVTRRMEADLDAPLTFWPGIVQSLMVSESGQLWVGTAGVSTCNPASFICRRLPRSREDSTRIHPSSVHALFEAPDEPGVIWIGNFGGLHRYDTRTGAVRRYEAPTLDPALQLIPAHIVLGSDGALWISTLGSGLSRFDRNTELFEHYPYDVRDTTTVANNHIEVVLERASEPGILWLGSMGGLDRFNMKTRRVERHFNEQAGLANNHIYGMLEDNDGRLWISSNRGISMFDPDAGTFRNYGTEDGLRELEFMQNAYTKGSGGMLYFGDVSGITAFVPDRLTTNGIVPPVAFTALRVDGQPTELVSALDIPFRSNSFSADFVALHFTNPTRNTFAYRLEGYDDRWIEAGTQRTASYTNLPPGDYTLRVKAANSDGVWNEEGITMDVTIRPPWYRTLWGYLFFATLMVGTIAGGARFQQARVVQRERTRSEIKEIGLRADAAESEAKALQAENARRKNIERLSEIGKEITSSLDFETIFGQLYAHVNDLTEAPVFGVGIYREEDHVLDYRMAIEDGKRYAPYTRDMRDTNQFPVWCITHRKPVFINDVEAEYTTYIDSLEMTSGTLEDGSESRQPRSLIYLPLTTQDRVLGVITVQSFEKNAYTEDDLNLLKTMAAYASVALDNANAYRQLNTTLEELRQTQQQLVQQEKMASLGQLTAGIAHEIKNPLNFVTNFADVNAELASELRELIDTHRGERLATIRAEIEDLVSGLQLNARQISKHGKRADSIVRGMMEHARQGDSERFDVSINGFVEEYVNLAWHGYRARFQDLQASVNTDYGKGVENARISPQDMGRVLINLMGNALDVVRPLEDGVLTVSTRRVGEQVEIRVSDNGPGVPEHIRSRIFEPFFTTKPTGEGTGLGLSMSHEIVTQGHGGTLTLEDTPGGGATFVVTLPATHS